jgi:hypothetical protein
MFFHICTYVGILFSSFLTTNVEAISVISANRSHFQRSSFREFVQKSGTILDKENVRTTIFIAVNFLNKIFYLFISLKYTTTIRTLHSIAMYKFLKTLHPGEIRTHDPVFETMTTAPGHLADSMSTNNKK